MSYTPMGMPPSSPEPLYTRPSREEPAIVYVLVLLPLLHLLQFPSGTLAALPTIAMTAVIAILGVTAAFADQRALFARAHLRRTTPWLAILPILYLGVRGSRRFDETGRGMTPFWVSAVIIVVVAVLLAYGPEGVLALLL